VECWCPAGKKWNDTKTACIDDPSAVKCWPGSYAATNPQTGKTECYCNPGLVWNSTKTACVDPQELVKTTDCSAYPGSYAAWNSQTQKVECWCPAGKKWNATMTACIDANTTNNNQNNNQGGGSGTWTLVSTTVTPATPGQGWTYSAQSSSVHLKIYNGDQADFHWTPPPQQFNSNGFTVSISVQGNPIKGSRVCQVIGVSGSGLTTETPSEQRIAQTKCPVDVGDAAQTSVTFKPYPNASDVEVKIDVSWGGVVFIYKYKRQ
jgi:hypothetical protein